MIRGFGCALVSVSLLSPLACSSTQATVTDAGGGVDSTTDSQPPIDAAAPPGPGATLKCTSSGKNAWLTYGAAGFVAVNKNILKNINAEITASGTKNLGDSLTKIGSGVPASTQDNAATFEGKLAAFLVYAYGGPTSIQYTDNKTYTGLQDMTVAHTGLAITSAQYNYFVSNIIVPALVAAGVPADNDGGTNDISSCFAPVILDPAFIATIVGH